jgi:hypothetical protein
VVAGRERKNAFTSSKSKTARRVLPILYGVIAPSLIARRRWRSGIENDLAVATTFAACIAGWRMFQTLFG